MANILRHRPLSFASATSAASFKSEVGPRGLSTRLRYHNLVERVIHFKVLGELRRSDPSTEIFYIDGTAGLDREVAHENVHRHQLSLSRYNC
jgi:hypothetical protein